MKRIIALLLLLSSFPVFAAERLPDAEIIRGYVNLARLHQIAFALSYRLVQYGHLDIGSSTHERAVALALLDAEMVDPWGTPYRIEIDGKRTRITGAGSDRKFEANAPPGDTRSSSADVVYEDTQLVRHNYTWLFRQVSKPPEDIPSIYTAPTFEPLHRRHPERLPATPDEARAFTFALEHPWVFVRYADFDVVRSLKTRASLELLAARLESYRAEHGSLKGLVGGGLGTLRSEPWPFNDWLPEVDEWGMPIQIVISPEGKSYRIASSGGDRHFDAEMVDASLPAIDVVVRDGRVAQSLDAVAYSTKLQAAQEKRDREVIARRSAAPMQAADGSMAWHVGGDVKPPVEIRKVDPDYPKELLKQGIGGVCIVELVIDEQGKVAHAEAVFGNKELGQAAVKAARQWTFQPATRHGKAVRSINKYTVMFKPE